MEDLERMQAEPWHHRPAIIVALLVVFPPAGIVLMWMRLPWSNKTKLVVSGVAGAWLVVLLVLGKAGRGGEAQALPSSAGAAKAALPATPQGPATDATPSLLPAQLPPSGLTMIENEPLLLIPVKLDGFALAQATRLPPKVALGANASYYGDNKHLVAHVTMNRSDVKVTPDEGLKAIKVGDHDGTIGEDKTAKTITIAWSATGWNGLVTLDYERAVDHSPAERAVQALAPQVAALLDSYLTGRPPGDTVRQEQLAAIAQANVTSKVKDFMSKIESAGITNDLVSNAGLKGDPNELILTVGTSWHRITRQERLSAARKLWNVWADINTPTDMDASRIALVDARGNRVGGSGVMGSSVKVDK